MKRLLFLISMLITCASYSNADEIVVPDIIIPKGSTATLDIQLNNEQQIRTEVQFLITLPEGITLVDNSSKLGERFNGMAVAPGDVSEGNNQWTVIISAAGATNNPIPEKSGTLVTVDLLADDSIEEGTELNGCLEVTDMNLAPGGSIVGDIQSLVNFKITIGQPDDGRLKFYETATTLPSYTAGEKADVTMFRTIKANQWSTICLPFAMSEAQVKAAFGEDVQLADFKGYDVTEEGGNIVGITVNFDNVTTIEANHPYIIRVNKTVTEFIVDGVDINPVDVPCVSFGKTTGRGSSAVYHPNDFVGTYIADFDFYHDAQKKALFLNDNKFYYATENTRYMKAFRAYFDFDDVLTEVEEAYSSRISMSFEEETTGISLNAAPSPKGEGIYTLDGRKVEKMRKGVYINEGKKVVVK